MDERRIKIRKKNMKVIRKSVIAIRIEMLLWLIGLCCVGLFVRMKFNAAQASNVAIAKFSEQTNLDPLDVKKSSVPIVQKQAVNTESFSQYNENYVPDKSAWSTARLTAFNQLKTSDMQLESIG